MESYLATTKASNEVIWLQMLMEELDTNKRRYIYLCDIQSASFSKESNISLEGKNIQIQYNFLSEKVEEWSVDIQNIQPSWYVYKANQQRQVHMV